MQRCPVFKGFADQHEIIIVINNVVKIYLQVKNENKTPLIPVFQVIFKDQYSEIFVQKYSNIRIIFGFENCHESNTNINIRRKIFEYSNIFEYSFVHWFET